MSMLCARDAARSAGLTIPAFDRIDPRHGMSNKKVRRHIEAAGWRILPIGRFQLPPGPVPGLVQLVKGRRGHLVYAPDIGDSMPLGVPGSFVGWVAVPSGTKVQRIAA